MKNQKTPKSPYLSAIVSGVCLLAFSSWIGEIFLISNGLLTKPTLYALIGLHIAAFMAPLLFVLWITPHDTAEIPIALCAGVGITIFAIPLTIIIVFVIIFDLTEKKVRGESFLYP